MLLTFSFLLLISCFGVVVVVVVVVDFRLCVVSLLFSVIVLCWCCGSRVWVGFVFVVWCVLACYVMYVCCDLWCFLLLWRVPLRVVECALLCLV